CSDEACYRSSSVQLTQNVMSLKKAMMRLKSSRLMRKSQILEHLNMKLKILREK
ncbi:hypothetical protein KI387_006811, partial [Taxus chinensis]